MVCIEWCMQLSTIVGDVAIDMGLDEDSKDKVSIQMELQNEREDNTAQA